MLPLLDLKKKKKKKKNQQAHNVETDVSSLIQCLGC